MKDSILKYLQERNEFVRKGEIEDVLRSKGFLMDTLGRTLRKMEVEGLIKVDYYKSAIGNKKLAKYASLQVEKPKKRVLVLKELPTGERIAVYEML